MPDYNGRRTMMVDTQVRPADVTKFPIIDAMLSVPRERFVPDRMREIAYTGENIDLGAGRVLLEPRSLGKMLDVLDIQRDHLVLDIGCGLGYGAAVLAHMAEAVVAVEEDDTMAAEAEAALTDTGADNATVHVGALTNGAAKHGPYDAILIEGGVGTVPPALIAQLADHGRIAAIFMEGDLGIARLGVKSAGTISWRYAFNATAPVLPGFERQVEFSL